ncbi:MAG: NAD(P)-dependent oxidoreductase [Myxococcota bacterium]
MNPVLLTGASGFLGRRLQRALRDSGLRVQTLGRHANNDHVWTAPAPPDPAWLEGASAMVHLAAYLPPCFDDPDEAAECLKVNAIGTLALFQAAAAAGVPHGVYVSSGNVYQPGQPTPEDAAVFPDHRGSTYLASKFLGEVWASHASRATGMTLTIVRPSAIYGPHMKGGVVRVFVDRLRHGEPIVLEDGGRFRSDLVFVDDVVRALQRILQLRAQGIFNVGSGESTSVHTLAATLVDLIGVFPEAIRTLPADDGPSSGFATLDIARARKELDLSPTPLSVGLGRLLAEEAS